MRQAATHAERLARRSAAPEAPLFAYGSLQFPEVLDVLLGRVPPLAPARAVGWRVMALPGVVYPGLVAGTTTVPGVTVAGLTEADWRIIDAFENDIYELRPVDLDDGATAWSYTCTDVETLTGRPWDRDLFAARDLPHYVERCARWRRAHTGT